MWEKISKTIRMKEGREGERGRCVVGGGGGQRKGGKEEEQTWKGLQ